jgi:hypothetical protein
MVSPLGPQPSASASSATSARRGKYIKVSGASLGRWARRLPGARALGRAYERWPRMTSALLLGTAMVLLMTLFSAGVGLAFRQWIALAAATALTAWLSVWIVFPEGDETPE